VTSIVVRYVLSFAAVGALASMGFACSSEAPTSEGTASQTPAPAAQATPSNEAPGLTGCEEIGGIEGTSLHATYDPAVGVSVFVPILGRATPTRMLVLAKGDPSTLQGRTVALGSAPNENLATCTHCFAMATGCREDGQADDCSTARWFFSTSGSIVFAEVPTAAGGAFSGALENVTLKEVTLDPATRKSTDVSGGACVHIKNVTFTSTMDGSGGGSGDAGSGSSDAKATDTGVPPRDAGTTDTGAIDSGTSGGGGGGGGGTNNGGADGGSSGSGGGGKPGSSA
jgi:hypothetical protein